MLEVIVVSGGFSKEREVSINTGNGVYENLDSKKYRKRRVNLWNRKDVIKLTKEKDPAQFFVFNALHGTFGEDGEFQRLLDEAGVSYTGCGLHASALCMDKLRAKEVLKTGGIKVPEGLCVSRVDSPELVERFFEKHKKVVVKPRCEGSSIGVSIIQRKEDLPRALKTAFVYSSDVLVEEFIEGVEITACVMGNSESDLEVLPVVEIVPVSDTFFSYEAKYTEGGSLHIVPARLSKTRLNEVVEIAKKAYLLTKCEVYSRIDMIVGKTGIYVLEINTLPGLTKTSLFPDSARSLGISYAELLDKIISLSLGKFSGLKVV